MISLILCSSTQSRVGQDEILVRSINPVMMFPVIVAFRGGILVRISLRVNAVWTYSKFGGVRRGSQIRKQIGGTSNQVSQVADLTKSKEGRAMTFPKSPLIDSIEVSQIAQN